MKRFGWVLVSMVVMLLIAALALPQERPRVKQSANAPVMEVLFEELDAADGSTLYMTMIRGSGFVACRYASDFFTIKALRATPEKWKKRVDIEEEKNACVQADDLDLVLVGPGDKKGTLTIAFRDRADVHSGLAWVIDCAAIPPAAEKICAYE